MFIHPMWDHESERIGMQKCTPSGYRLRSAADLLGYVGLLLLLAGPTLLIASWIRGNFKMASLWLLVLPWLIGFASEVLYRRSVKLAASKNFRYDDISCGSSWIESGKTQTYKWTGE